MTFAELGLPGELVSIPRVTRELLALARDATAHDATFFEHLLRRCGCSVPEGVITELRLFGFFAARPPGFAVSSRGHRTLLFTSGALGSPSDKIFEELRVLEPSLYPYELVREGMTSRFIKNLLNEPGFQRLYLCSPWINLQRDDFARLVLLCHKTLDDGLPGVT